MRTITLLALLTVLSGCAPALNIIADRTFPSRPAQYRIESRPSVGFTTPDGIPLRADVYLPVGLKKAPTLLVRIPFTNTLGNRIRSQVIARHWAARGYAVVIQGTRGRYKSGGRFYPMRHERDDGIATLRWLSTQPWYDGRLAMWGGSSFGHTQWAIADQQNPGPTALSIQIASTSFREMFHPGGAFSLESALQWTIRSRGQEDREVDLDDLQRGAEHLPVIESDDIAIGDTDFYNDWLQHRDNDEYWREIDGVDRTKTLKAPTLLIAGWYDPFLPTQLADFTRITANSRLIIGPWAHAQALQLPGASAEVPYRASSVTLSTAWFDSIFGFGPELPRVSIYVMGANRWRDENEWPLARTEYRPFYLTSGAPSRSFTYDPLNPVPTVGGAMLSERAGVKLQNEIEQRPDVLLYSTQPLKQPLEVTGPIRAVLYVATDAPTTDFTAKLVDVHPDGSAYNLSDGILRRDYAVPNTPTRIEIELWPTSNVFLTGHRIRLEISSSNFPRYDRNLNTGEPGSTAKKGVPAQQTIFHSSEYPSQLILPLIEDR